VPNGVPGDNAGNLVDPLGVTEPDFTALASLRYQVGSIGVNLRQRYIPETAFDNAWGECVDVDDNSIEVQTTTDLTLFYDSELSSGHTWRASLSITNLFDTDSPVMPDSSAANRDSIHWSTLRTQVSVA